MTDLRSVTVCVFSPHRKESQPETSPRSVLGLVFYLSSPPLGFSSILLLAAVKALFLGECVYTISVRECVFVCWGVTVNPDACHTWTWLCVKCLLQEWSCCICSHGAQRSAHFGLTPNWQLY